MKKQPEHPDTFVKFEQRWNDELSAFNDLALKDMTPDQIREAIKVLQRQARIFQNHADNLAYFLTESP